VLVIGNMGIILMGIVFYGRLMIVSMLIVIPNGNAHYYFSRIVILMSIVNPTRSMYLRVVVLAIAILVVVL
jgi:hypothetical protein